MMTFIRVTAYENICKKEEIVTSQVVVQVDFLLVSSEALAIISVFIDHVKSDNITITTNYLSPDPTCAIHNLSLIWLDTGWTQWLGLWLNGFCLCISMMDSLWTWRTVASDPDGMSLQSDDVCPAHALGVRPCESGGVSCLWLSLNTDINIQRSASCEPRVTRSEIESLWPGPGPDTRHRLRRQLGKLCQCLDSDNVVSDDPGMCHGPWSVILFEQIFDLGNDTRRLWFYQQFIATLKYFRLLEIFKLSTSTCALSKEVCFIHLTRLHFRRTGVIREFYTQLHKINMAR